MTFLLLLPILASGLSEPQLYLDPVSGKPILCAYKKPCPEAAFCDLRPGLPGVTACYSYGPTNMTEEKLARSKNDMKNGFNIATDMSNYGRSKHEEKVTAERMQKEQFIRQRIHSVTQENLKQFDSRKAPRMTTPNAFQTSATDNEPNRSDYTRSQVRRSPPNHKQIFKHTISKNHNFQNLPTMQNFASESNNLEFHSTSQIPRHTPMQVATLVVHARSNEYTGLSGNVEPIVEVPNAFKAPPLPKGSKPVYSPMKYPQPSSNPNYNPHPSNFRPKVQQPTRSLPSSIRRRSQFPPSGFSRNRYTLRPASLWRSTQPLPIIDQLEPRRRQEPRASVTTQIRTHIPEIDEISPKFLSYMTQSDQTPRHETARQAFSTHYVEGPNFNELPARTNLPPHENRDGYSDGNDGYSKAVHHSTQPMAKLTAEYSGRTPDSNLPIDPPQYTSQVSHGSTSVEHTERYQSRKPRTDAEVQTTAVSGPSQATNEHRQFYQGEMGSYVSNDRGQYSNVPRRFEQQNHNPNKFDQLTEHRIYSQNEQPAQHELSKQNVQPAETNSQSFQNKGFTGYSKNTNRETENKGFSPTDLYYNNNFGLSRGNPGLGAQFTTHQYPILSTSNDAMIDQQFQSTRSLQQVQSESSQNHISSSNEDQKPARYIDFSVKNIDPIPRRRDTTTPSEALLRKRSSLPKQTHRQTTHKRRDVQTMINFSPITDNQVSLKPSTFEQELAESPFRSPYYRQKEVEPTISDKTVAWSNEALADNQQPAVEQAVTNGMSERLPDPAHFTEDSETTDQSGSSGIVSPSTPSHSEENNMISVSERAGAFSQFVTQANSLVDPFREFADTLMARNWQAATVKKEEQYQTFDPRILDEYKTTHNNGFNSDVTPATKSHITVESIPKWAMENQSANSMHTKQAQVHVSQATKENSRQYNSRSLERSNETDSRQLDSGGAISANNIFHFKGESSGSSAPIRENPLSPQQYFTQLGAARTGRPGLVKGTIIGVNRYDSETPNQYSTPEEDFNNFFTKPASHLYDEAQDRVTKPTYPETARKLAKYRGPKKLSSNKRRRDPIQASTTTRSPSSSLMPITRTTVPSIFTMHSDSSTRRTAHGYSKHWTSRSSDSVTRKAQPGAPTYITPSKTPTTLDGVSNRYISVELGDGWKPRYTTRPDEFQGKQVKKKGRKSAAPSLRSILSQVRSKKPVVFPGLPGPIRRSKSRRSQLGKISPANKHVRGPFSFPHRVKPPTKNARNQAFEKPHTGDADESRKPKKQQPPRTDQAKRWYFPGNRVSSKPKHIGKLGHVLAVERKTKEAASKMQSSNVLHFQPKQDDAVKRSSSRTPRAKATRSTQAANHSTTKRQTSSNSAKLARVTTLGQKAKPVYKDGQSGALLSSEQIGRNTTQTSRSTQNQLRTKQNLASNSQSNRLPGLTTEIAPHRGEASSASSGGQSLTNSNVPESNTKPSYLTKPTPRTPTSEIILSDDEWLLDQDLNPFKSSPYLDEKLSKYTKYRTSGKTTRSYDVEGRSNRVPIANINPTGSPVPTPIMIHNTPVTNSLSSKPLRNKNSGFSADTSRRIESNSKEFGVTKSLAENYVNAFKNYFTPKSTSPNRYSNGTTLGSTTSEIVLEGAYSPRDTASTGRSWRNDPATKLLKLNNVNSQSPTNNLFPPESTASYSPLFTEENPSSATKYGRRYTSKQKLPSYNNSEYNRKSTKITGENVSRSSSKYNSNSRQFATSTVQPSFNGNYGTTRQSGRRTVSKFSTPSVPRGNYGTNPTTRNPYKLSTKPVQTFKPFPPVISAPTKTVNTGKSESNLAKSISKPHFDQDEFAAVHHVSHSAPQSVVRFHQDSGRHIQYGRLGNPSMEDLKQYHRVEGPEKRNGVQKKSGDLTFAYNDDDVQWVKPDDSFEESGEYGRARGSRIGEIGESWSAGANSSSKVGPGPKWDKSTKAATHGSKSRGMKHSVEHRFGHGSEVSTDRSFEIDDYRKESAEDPRQEALKTSRRNNHQENAQKRYGSFEQWVTVMERYSRGQKPWRGLPSDVKVLPNHDPYHPADTSAGLERSANLAATRSTPRWHNNNVRLSTEQSGDYAKYKGWKQYGRKQMQCPSADKVYTCKACVRDSECSNGFICCSYGAGKACSAPVNSYRYHPEVIQLVNGTYDRIAGRGTIAKGSISLIRAQEQLILVDTGTVTQYLELFQSLAELDIQPENISIVINTHGHAQHVSNQNLFPDAIQIFNDTDSIGDVFWENPLTTGRDYPLCAGDVKLIHTPGHSNSDITVMVKNVPYYGTIAIAGDVFLNENDVYIETFRIKSANIALQERSRKKVACNADYIVPGHGGMFRVNNEMKLLYQCGAEFTVKNR